MDKGEIDPLQFHMDITSHDILNVNVFIFYVSILSRSGCYHHGIVITAIRGLFLGVGNSNNNTYLGINIHGMSI